jgi:predicted peroxiredoxin
MSLAGSISRRSQAGANGWSARPILEQVPTFLSTGMNHHSRLGDSERVTVAFLVAVGAAEKGRPTLKFLTKEAVRLANPGFAHAVACDGCPPLADLMDRYEKAGGRFLVCPICFDARKIDKGNLLSNAAMGAPSQCGTGSATRLQPPSATEVVCSPHHLTERWCGPEQKGTSHGGHFLSRWASARRYGLPPGAHDRWFGLGSAWPPLLRPALAHPRPIGDVRAEPCSKGIPSIMSFISRLVPTRARGRLMQLNLKALQRSGVQLRDGAPVQARTTARHPCRTVSTTQGPAQPLPTGAHGREVVGVLGLDDHANAS